MSLAVADRLAVADLVHLYAAAVDDRRFRDVAELFTETAELRLPDPPRELLPVRHWHGRDGVLSALSSLTEVARTQHEVVGEVYAAGPEADYALGRITAVAHHWTFGPEHPTDLVWHVRYDDEYLRTPVGWRIHGRALTINAIETRPLRRLRGGPSAPGRPSADPAGAAGRPATSPGPRPPDAMRRGQSRETR
jgi:hypothetical protein